MSAKNGPYAVLMHASRCCFARVLARSDDDGRLWYRCSNCDVEVEGRDHRVICACGTKLRTGAGAGLVCVEREPTPECQSRVVVEAAAGGKK